MFGSMSSPKEEESEGFGTDDRMDTSSTMTPRSESISKSPTTTRLSRDDTTPPSERKRRSTGVGKAKEMLSSAKQSIQSFASSNSDNNNKNEEKITSPLQRLGRADPALSVPQGPLNNSAGESLPGPRSTFRVGVTEDRNRKCRRTMEDTHAYLYNFLSTPAPIVDGDDKDDTTLTIETSNDAHSVTETDNGYFAIFDGHAGSFAADWCGKKVHLLLEEIIRKNPNTPIPELLDQTFTTVDHQLEKLPLKNSGCTAVAAVLRWEDRISNSRSATGSTALAPATAAVVNGLADTNNKTTQETSTSLDSEVPQSEAGLKEAATRQRVLYTANVGDARIVLCRDGKALRLSYDHKGSDEHEGKRIAGAGGLILNNRVNGVLAVTRALGDSYMKDLVTGHPYTTETVIQPDIDEFLILACDGLWDVCSDQEAVDHVRAISDPQIASKMLVDHALSRFSTDNLSCMIVRFDPQKVQHVTERKAEAIGVEGDPRSQAGGISEADAIVQEQRSKLEKSGELIDHMPDNLHDEGVKKPKTPVITLNPEAVEAARKDRKSASLSQPSSAIG